MDIKITLNGREVRPGDLKSAMEKAALETIKDGVQKRLSGVRCPEHHKAPRVTASGSSLERLSWKIDGCCEKLIDAAKKAFR